MRGLKSARTAILGVLVASLAILGMSAAVATSRLGATELQAGTDTTPPTTSLIADPPANSAGWNDTPVAITLEATDDISGVASTRCLVDGAARSTTTTINLDSDGEHFVEYSSEDASGNVEATKTAAFNIDTTPPELSLDAHPSYTTVGTIHVQASDGCSGLARVESRLDSGPWTAGTQLSTRVLGTHTFFARAFDIAGNERDASAIFTVAAPPADATFASLARYGLSNGARRVRATEKKLHSWAFTYYTAGRKWVTTGTGGWASGFFPGELWAAYAACGDSWFRKHAISREKPLGKTAITSTSTDIGFRYFYSYAKAYELTGNSGYRNMALKAAKGEARRFNTAVGAIRSRNDASQCQTIIDEMMNVQILYWGADHGGPASWRTLAHQHALTTARDFVRPDGSVYHIVGYNPKTGALEDRYAGQGYSLTSMWSRGQAWAIYGFTTAYRETKDPAMLATARKVADRYLAELPPDFVPYWDFRSPSIPNTPRDSSAAAIAASALLDLATLDPSSANRARYAGSARIMLTSLMSPNYRSTGGNPAILLHGTQCYSIPQTRDEGQSFGDYFLLEAFLRLRTLPADGPALRLKRVRASRGKPTAAIDHKMSTSWKASKKQWIEFDLGKRVTVHSVSLGVRSGQTRSALFKIYTSRDRRHWKLSTKVVSSGETAAVETYALKPVNARYVRVVCNGSSRSKTLYITEAAVR